MLLVHLDLSSAEEPHATLHDSGRWIGRAALDRRACDCSYVVSDGKGVGPKSRTVPMHVQRALLMRDKTCTFPGCTHRGFVDAHHLRHWARGGAATLDNLILLCTYHHRLVHDGGFSVVRSEEGLSFRRPDGSRVTVGPPRRAGPYGDVA